jgi:hypothetical protein
MQACPCNLLLVGMLPAEMYEIWKSFKPFSWRTSKDSFLNKIWIKVITPLPHCPQSVSYVLIVGGSSLSGLSNLLTIANVNFCGDVFSLKTCRCAGKAVAVSCYCTVGLTVCFFVQIPQPHWNPCNVMHDLWWVHFINCTVCNRPQAREDMTLSSPVFVYANVRLFCCFLCGILNFLYF